MNRNKKLLLAIFIPLLGIALYLFYNTGSDVISRHNTIEKAKRVDRQVIKKLKQIREVQKIYYSVNITFTQDWPELIKFVKHDSIPIIQKSESVISVGGKDSVVVQIDTIGKISVFDSLQSVLKFTSRSDVASLKYVPESDSIFVMETAEQKEGKHILQFLEVRDPYPLNERRRDGGDWPPLRFGSLIQPTLKGNWE